VSNIYRKEGFYLEKHESLFTITVKQGWGAYRERPRKVVENSGGRISREKRTTPGTPVMQDY
jgi:hypothetical protein